MRPKTLILMVVAVGCGLAASVMTRLYLADASQQPAQPVVEEVPVLVARKAIPAYTTLKDATLFEVKHFRKSDVTSDVIGDFEKVKGRTLKNALAANKTLVEGDMIPEGAKRLIFDLKPGERAMPVRVNPDTAGGGFISPGDRVDVLATQLRRAGSDEPYTKTILQNIEVLAVNQDTTPAEGQLVKPPDRMILRVTLEQAEELAVFADTGNIRLVPRNPLDEKVEQTTGAKASGNRGLGTQVGKGLTPAETGGAVPTLAAPVVPEAPKAEPPPEEIKVEPAKNRTVTIVNGGVKTYEFEPSKEDKEREKAQLEKAKAAKKEKEKEKEGAKGSGGQ
jgi:pilus assembly protein CpaB